MVDLFFVVSGFVFAHVYLRDGAMRKGVRFPEFAKARFARLYPLHFVTLLIVAGLVFWGTRPSRNGRGGKIPKLPIIER